MQESRMISRSRVVDVYESYDYEWQVDQIWILQLPTAQYVFTSVVSMRSKCLKVSGFVYIDSNLSVTWHVPAACNDDCKQRWCWNEAEQLWNQHSVLEFPLWAVQWQNWTNSHFAWYTQSRYCMDFSCLNTSMLHYYSQMPPMFFPHCLV